MDFGGTIAIVGIDMQTKLSWYFVIREDIFDWMPEVHLSEYAAHIRVWPQIYSTGFMFEIEKVVFE